MSLRCKRPTSLVMPTVGCWKMILTFSQHTAAIWAVPLLVIPLLVGRSLEADVDIVLAGDGGQLVVANVAVKSFNASNIAVERISFFCRLVLFLDDTKQLVLMGDWNAILDPKIDKVGQRARRLGRCDSSLVGLMTRHNLVDRFHLDHPGREMWMWLDSSPSAKVGSYLDRVLDKLILILLVVPRSTW